MNNPVARFRMNVQPEEWLPGSWRLLVGGGLSTLCLFLALRDISWANLREALYAAQWSWVALAVGVVVTGTFMKAIRWHTLFPSQRISIGEAWSIFLIGQMLNTVLPARAGEIGRVYLIGKTEGVARAGAVSTIVIEKVSDIVMLMLAYSIVALYPPTGLPEWLQEAGIRLLAVAMVSLGAVLFAIYFTGSIRRLFHRAMRLLSHRWRAAILERIEQLIAAFQVLQSVKVSAKIAGWTLLIWGGATLTNLLLFRAFRLALSPYVALFLLVVLMSGAAAPPLPGNIGVFPYLCILVLSLFGVKRETGLVYGVTLQAVVYLPLIVLGSICLLRKSRDPHSSHPSPSETAKG